MTATVQFPVEPRVKEFTARRWQLLIDGEWVKAKSEQTFQTHNPATGELLAECAQADEVDIDRAVTAARRAFENGPWPTMTASERGRLIWKLGDLIFEHLEELAELETLDNGKPLSVTRVVDVPLAAELFQYMAGWANKLEGNTIPLSVPYTPGAMYHAYTLREPLGVVGQIVPWNFPLLMAAWKLGPALAGGNTVVFKPAEHTPLTALRLGELIIEAGFPKGVVNVVPGPGPIAGDALASHPDVDKIAFTGSTAVGKRIIDAAKGNLKKVTLELGGKSPNVVFADADMELAIPGAASAIFFNHGQVCSAGSRLFVEESVFPKVTEGVAETARRMKVGPGMDPATEMGPLVAEEQLDRVCGYLESGYAEGARALTGGKKIDGPGYFIEPTVLVDTTPDMKVVREEIFGPVVTVHPFTREKDVLPAANDTIYGLGSGIWTKDLSKAHRMAAQMHAGTVWVNCYNIFDAALPFGGYKQSGWGREMGHEVLNLYTQIKSVCMQL
ncbi:MAG: phenylacetaldehyde dehydrogenase [Kribbellaceae bacterium]|nr:phenylacetaldehyde dehydrogenase [Kribbellaceae bacterium]